MGGDADMSGPSDQSPLPAASDISRAIDIYLEVAYEGQASTATASVKPSADGDPRVWLMSDRLERDPPDAPLGGVRSFALRLGNKFYPHMKLRLSHPPKELAYLFTVDSHDSFLHAADGSGEEEALEEMKRRNARITERIMWLWERAGLETERTYLRRKIREARARGG